MKMDTSKMDSIQIRAYHDYQQKDFVKRLDNMVDEAFAKHMPDIESLIREVRELKVKKAKPAPKPKPATPTDLLKSIEARLDILLKAETAKEQHLDDSFRIQNERIKTIIDRGFDATLDLSPSPVKCHVVTDNTLHFLPGTTLHVGAHVMKNGQLLTIIKGIEQQAGRVVCTTWTPKHTINTFSSFSTPSGQTNLKPLSIANIDCVIDLVSGVKTITTFNRSIAIDTIINHSGDLYTITGKFFDGNLVNHRIEPFTLDMPQQERKHATAAPRMVQGAFC